MFRHYWNVLSPGALCLSPKDSWDKLQLPCNPEFKENEWMDDGTKCVGRKNIGKKIFFLSQKVQFFKVII